MNARVDFSVNQAKKILLTQKPFDKNLNFFKNASVDVFEITNLIDIINSYQKSEICSILVESGPRLVNSFLKEGIVDELIIYTSKKELGKEIPLNDVKVILVKYFEKLFEASFKKA